MFLLVCTKNLGEGIGMLSVEMLDRLFEMHSFAV